MVQPVRRRHARRPHVRVELAEPAWKHLLVEAPNSSVVVFGCVSMPSRSRALSTCTDLILRGILKSMAAAGQDTSQTAYPTLIRAIA